MGLVVVDLYKIKIILSGTGGTSVMSATDMLGHRDIRGLACLPQILVRDGGFSVCTMPKDVGMLLYNYPQHVCEWG